MALSIKTEEADRLARELAAVTGETMTEAVTTALRERLSRVRRAARDSAGYAERVKRAAEPFRAFAAPTKADFDALWTTGEDR